MLLLEPGQMHSAPTNQLPADTAINNLSTNQFNSCTKAIISLAYNLRTKEKMYLVILSYLQGMDEIPS
jgi:hypothetical protein